MKFRLLVIFLLLMPLAACIGNTPTPATTVGATSAAATKAPAASPTPATSPYPSPADLYPTQAGSGQSIYPGPKSGDTITWEQAVSLIMNNEVTQVTQAHSLQVTLTLKDGRALITEEPQIDAVFEIITNCGQPCSAIIQATE